MDRVYPARYHHPARAARAGTPVRSRFCNSCARESGQCNQYSIAPPALLALGYFRPSVSRTDHNVLFRQSRDSLTPFTTARLSFAVILFTLIISKQKPGNYVCKPLRNRIHRVVFLTFENEETPIRQTVHQ